MAGERDVLAEALDSALVADRGGGYIESASALAGNVIKQLAAHGWRLVPSAETSSAYLLGYEAARATPSPELLPREALDVVEHSHTADDHTHECRFQDATGEPHRHEYSHVHRIEHTHRHKHAALSPDRPTPP